MNTWLKIILIKGKVLIFVDYQNYLIKYNHINSDPINMENIFPVPDYGGPAAFFGFMGVSMALVLASKNSF